MNGDLFRRLKRLEVRITPYVQPLTIFVNRVPLDQRLGPGERIVTDVLQRTPLLVVVSERITADRNDQGERVHVEAGL